VTRGHSWARQPASESQPAAVDPRREHPRGQRRTRHRRAWSRANRRRRLDRVGRWWWGIGRWRRRLLSLRLLDRRDHLSVGAGEAELSVGEADGRLAALLESEAFEVGVKEGVTDDEAHPELRVCGRLPGQRLALAGDERVARELGEAGRVVGCRSFPGALEAEGAGLAEGLGVVGGGESRGTAGGGREAGAEPRRAGLEGEIRGRG